MTLSNIDGTMEIDIGAAISAGFDFLTSTGIRHQNGGELASGGVCRGYDWKKRDYQYIYSEITGYAISALVNGYRLTDEDRYLELAHQSANYLSRVQNQSDEPRISGGIAHSLVKSLKKVNPQYYSFDSAMCLQGLLDLHAIAPASNLLETAEAIGIWLCDQMQLKSGGFRSLSVVPDEDIIHESYFPNDDPIYGDETCLHAKHAIGLSKLGRVKENPRYLDCARKVCDWVLGLQNEDGSFRASDRSTEVHSHPHCYATEGLLFAYDQFEEEQYIIAARRAAQWLMSMQNSDGSLNQVFKRKWWPPRRDIKSQLFPHKVSDATAQAIRIWLIIYYLDGNSEYLEACKRAVGFLLRMQVTSSPDPNANGGFYYWPGYSVLYTWCTMFTQDALQAFENAIQETDNQKIIAGLF